MAAWRSASRSAAALFRKGDKTTLAMSRVITLVFSGFGAVGASAIGALFLRLRPHTSAARKLVIGVALFYLLASTYAVPRLVAAAWNSGYQRFEPQATSARTAIVLLGEGG